MSATATPTAKPSSDGRTARRPLARGTKLVHEPAPSASQERGWVVLFQVPFASTMSDSGLALLARTLDLVTHMHPKMHPDPNGPGVVRLDHFSGLFLERGVTDGEWVLEARTWGQPAPESVHEWHLLAAGAACRLDRSVPVPERLPASAPDTSTHPVGRAANARLAGLRRRLVGLQ